MAKVYGERWEVVESLGEGGQAHAFRVRDLRDPDRDDRWVLKRLRNTSRLGRFEDEIQALQRITSPRIPKVRAYSLGDPAYLVYPYIGPSIDHMVRELSFDQALDLYEDVVEAVWAAHRHRVAHRDVKPGNILVDEDHGRRRAYLIDFGICQIANGRLHTLADEGLGSRDFAAPELVAGATHSSGFYSDSYSLGKLLYWMVTGGGFFAREEFEPALSRVPNDRGVERSYVRGLLSRTVLVSPERRASAESLREDVGVVKRLIRLGVNMVGTKDQTCPICRQGTLRRRTGFEIRERGFSPQGTPAEHFRLLHCDYCGYLQAHDISGTGAQHLWEI